MLETNTFTASRPALAAYGLENKVGDINTAGVKIARECSGEYAYVAGSVGPISWTKKGCDPMTRDEMLSIFIEQIGFLAEAGADVILLETFTNLDELHVAYMASREACKLPVITQVSLKYMGEEKFEGLLPEDAAKAMDSWGSNVIGVNCCDGPQGVFEAVKRMASATSKPISAMPNAGLPQMINGRLLYMASPEYMAEYARRYAQVGVLLIGGCCGTTSEHIKEMKKFLKPLSPNESRLTKKNISVENGRESKKIEICRIPIADKGPFGAAIDAGFAVSVEADPPLGMDVTKVLDGVKMLKDFGADAVNIADGPRAMARMNPIALAVIIRNNIDIQTVVHYCCRDRNILGMQMDLMGAAALGLNNVLIITGDPPKMGHYPDASAVFDLDSIGLIKFVSNLNVGLDFAERPIRQPTNFLIGCGFNPGAIDIDLEVERFKQKVNAGAEFAFSQPVFDAELLSNFLDRTKDVLNIPIFVGVLPLVSLRNAEFLHNEVPGMQIPKRVLDAMAMAESREAQRTIGISIAREALETAKKSFDRVKGAYIFPPFGKYELVENLIKVVK